jgi:transcriptional regulator with XRE-family HTH domain
MPDYLRELRERGLSLRKFALRVGLSPEWVSKVFRGEEEASAETERRITAALENCPWCGNKWPHPIVFDSEGSTRPETTARRA